MTIFLGKENIEIEFKYNTSLYISDRLFRANKIGFKDIEYILCNNTLTLVTSECDRIIITPIDCVKSIKVVDTLSVNQFGEPIEREDFLE